MKPPTKPRRPDRLEALVWRVRSLEEVRELEAENRARERRERAIYTAGLIAGLACGVWLAILATRARRAGVKLPAAFVGCN